MTKTLSIGIENDSSVNYVTANIYSSRELEQLCSELADYIIQKYDKYLLVWIINHNYCYFNKTEKKEVYRLSEEMKALSNKDSLQYNRQKFNIEQALFDYFYNEQETTLILDGFVRFRLDSYIRELEYIIDKAVDEYLLKQEYRDFIVLLKYCVNTQRSMIDTVHVLANRDHTYQITDEQYRSISSDQFVSLQEEYELNAINDDDFLISTLITLAPKQVVLHHKNRIENKNLLHTIEQVFEDRVIICDGCCFCDSK